VKDQLALFAGDEDDAAVEPVVDAHDLDLRAALPEHVRFGTCTWTFPGWRGIVYAGTPSEGSLRASGLRAYARFPLFRTVSIDRAFYEPLSAETLDGYARSLPPDFRAMAKMWSEIVTYVPKHGSLAGKVNPNFLSADVAAQVVAPYRGAFRPHTGPFTLEIPPVPDGALPTRAFLGKLERFLERLPTDFRYAVELRNRAYFTPRYLAILRAHRVAHVFNFWTGMPELRVQLAAPGSITTDFVVSRLLLPPFTRYGERKVEYAPFNRIGRAEPGMREDVLELVRQATEAGSLPVYVVVNNKAEGCAPLTVRALEEALVARLRGVRAG
jgi:uncharacterized protein YecE (DUF72 family)